MNPSQFSKENVAIAEGPWDVYFDPGLGGPGETLFEDLHNWVENTDERVKYYSGIAVYRKNIILPESAKTKKNESLYLDLGEMHHMARVWVNGRDAGVVWTAPWSIRIDKYVKPGNNVIEIHVANLWPNRLIGDERLPYDGIANRQWPEWLVKGESRTSGRVTFTTYNHFRQDSELIRSGLIGPVAVVKIKPDGSSR